MNRFNRRNFVFLSSGAALGNMVVSGVASAVQDDHTDGLDFSHSGLVTGEPKPLKHNSIPGFLSAEQIAPHHTAHYGGALRGYLSADATVEAAIKSGEASLMIAGGVESMSRAPFVMPKATSAFSRKAEIYDTTLGWRFVNKKLKARP